jgi:hypothetical protein
VIAEIEAAGGFAISVEADLSDPQTPASGTQHRERHHPAVTPGSCPGSARIIATFPASAGSTLA